MGGEKLKIAAIVLLTLLVLVSLNNTFIRSGEEAYLADAEILPADGDPHTMGVADSGVAAVTGCTWYDLFLEDHYMCSECCATPEEETYKPLACDPKEPGDPPCRQDQADKTQ